jgi:hypothetical protein
MENRSVSGSGKTRSEATVVRKAYEPPQLIVYGKVSEITHGGRGRGRGRGNGGGNGRGNGRGHGGSRS